jgi:hypothetical protein
VDAEVIYQQLLTRLPAERFHSPTLAFEVVRFCVDNVTLLHARLPGLLRPSFPSLFKVCSTGPRVSVGPGLGRRGLGVAVPQRKLGRACPQTLS